MSQFSRRELIAGLLGLPVAAVAGCTRSRLPEQGGLLSTNFSAGHRIRDGANLAVSESTEIPVVIVGGGIAGLSAGWKLMRAGFENFVILELEDQPGGTSRSGRSGDFAYPWGAHYIPVPMASNRSLVELVQEMDLVDSLNDDGSPNIKEQFLCRDPEERLFRNGSWAEGLFQESEATEEERQQVAAFRKEVDRWVGLQDAVGRRCFSLPMSSGSDNEEVRALDSISMGRWLDDRGWKSPRLRWLVNYACRDDYGLTCENTSAWAGLFYFASRIAKAGGEPQSVITWPEGNGRFVDHFAATSTSKIRCNQAVCSITPALDGSQQAAVKLLDTTSNQAAEIRAQQVIFAAPQMLAKHVIAGYPELQNRDFKAFQYGSWLVANVQLRDRPVSKGFSLSWDNVLYDSKSLGYINCTHQTGSDFGPTVLTWYYPFAESAPNEVRKQMLELEWADWADLVLADLRLAHPEIDSLVERLDIMLWGHAMIQPTVGFIWGGARERAARPIGPIHFAGADLSGIALFEEAFYHGVRSAEEVMQQLGHRSETT